jgi:glycine/D-amino acid oxidase-like deaminating enzyme
MRVLVAGGGIFGLTAALALRDRKCDVTLVDPGPLPHPLAESTDISKIVRIDYGADEDYTQLGERALERWRRWPDLFHETGVTFLSRARLEPGGFEYDSYELLTRRGHALERLDADAIVRRFPAYKPGAYVDGYFNPQGGWAHASAVVTKLAADAIARGVVIRTGTIDRAEIDADAADLVIVCAGAWAPRIVPELAGSLRAVGQPVFHLRPRDPSLFEAARFPVFGADISRTGYYGFPIDRDGIVKIANHGTGISLAPDGPRVVSDTHESALRDMLRDSFPALADAPIVFRRLCVYCDTADEHFWIARDPNNAKLVVATGGSGHAFKFAPVLGELIAAIALGEPHPLSSKFRWRPELRAPQGSEAARHRG